MQQIVKYLLTFQRKLSKFQMILGHIWGLSCHLKKVYLTSLLTEYSQPTSKVR